MYCISTTESVSRSALRSPARKSKFAKANKKPELRGALVDGMVYSADEANELAKLPGLNDLRAMILQLLTAPATQIVRVVAAPGTQLVRVLDARREQLEQQG